MSKSLKDMCKEGWDDFRAPAKQAKENLKDDITDAVSDIREGDFSSAGGCLKKFLVWGIVIVLFVVFARACASDTPEKNETSTPIQTEESVQNSPELDSDELSLGDDFYFLAQQMKYAEQHKIALNNFPKERKALLKSFEALGDDLNFLTTDNILGAARYKITVEQTEYVYSGTLKDNYPDGFGVILKSSDVYYDTTDALYGAMEFNGAYYNIVYIGNFSKGRFSGYGLQYSLPDNYKYSLLCKLYNGSVSDDKFKEYYLGWLNYVTYDGIFKDGKACGMGNSYGADLDVYLHLPDSVGENEITDAQYDAIVAGEFKNDIEDGNCKMYSYGKLIYDGGMKNGAKDGYGRSYYQDGSLEYEGKYKNNKKDGKGTLYKQDGSVVYDGEWQADDYK